MKSMKELMLAFLQDIYYAERAGLRGMAKVAKAAGIRAYGEVYVDSGTKKEQAKSLTEEELTGISPSTEAYALLFARKIRGKLATTW